jgi:hypothetical protein
MIPSMIEAGAPGKIVFFDDLERGASRPISGASSNYTRREVTACPAT